MVTRSNNVYKQDSVNIISDKPLSVLFVFQDRKMLVSKDFYSPFGFGVHPVVIRDEVGQDQNEADQSDHEISTCGHFHISVVPMRSQILW